MSICKYALMLNFLTDINQAYKIPLKAITPEIQKTGPLAFCIRGFKKGKQYKLI